MKKINKQLVYSPTDLIKFMESPFITWMDRYDLEVPDQIKPDETDESFEILQNKGNLHEKAFLKKIKDAGREIVEIPQDSNSYAATRLAMSAGKDIIYQANLATSEGLFNGYADFLFKIEGKSKLGDWHYEAWDTKLALKPKPYFVIQLCCYSEMLESIQGVLPRHMRIVLGNEDIRAFNTDKYFYYYKRLKNAFLKQQSDFDQNTPPELTGIENYGQWTSHAEKILKGQDHLSIVANIKKVQIKKLHKIGITTLTQLARSTLKHVPKMDPNALRSLKQQASLQLQSRGKSNPDYEIITPVKEDPKRGLALLPPASANDVWFDMEGYPYVKGGLEYLFGVAFLDSAGAIAYKDWWAHDAQQEKQAFQDFVNWIYIRWKDDPTMHIYHYAPYEITALKRLMGHYGNCEEQIDSLLRGNVFIDLYKVTCEGLRIGEPKYSLKNIEHLYKDARNTKVAKATDSIVYYERWLEEKDGVDWQSSILLREIRAYNQEDCISTKNLCDWLRNVQKQAGIHYFEKQDPQKNEASSSLITAENEVRLQDQAFNLAQELLVTIEMNNDLSKEQIELIGLMAHLLEFHRREDKPMWWSKFDRQDMTDEQLIEDINCLGGLERTKTPPKPIKQSYLYEYKFDVGQDTKLIIGKTCFYVNGVVSSSSSVIIEELNIDQGLVNIKLGAKQEVPPYKLNLIPYEYVSTDTILRSIYVIVKQWQETGKLPLSIEDFLLRRKPKIIGHFSDDLINNKELLLKEIIDLVKNMDGTTLCIQGPPGSGKTFTAAHVIAELVRSGQTVGITSNGHKAIAHLIDEVMEVTSQKDITLCAVKIQSSSEIFHVKDKRVKQEAKADKVFSIKRYNLIGGTAWAFAHEQAQAKLDYLFVDEAGQVSIANLFGMSKSARNIVLMGDQMQLSQPIKGSHPGESGKSCLEYYLEEHQTIPNNRGVFLDKTYRLHPDICEFISSTSYENRLDSHESTSHRQLVLTQRDNDLITKDSGLLFIPVEHEDNNQSSDEEVEKINNIINILLRSSFKVKNIARTITFDDILIVAPYNMQVRKIQEAQPHARVGSVDKFQGQEAPIVIMSMCSSNASDAVRGLEFVLSKNRINVAVSRAQVLAIIVGSSSLADVSCKTLKQMELVNLFCKIMDQGSSKKSLISAGPRLAQSIPSDFKQFFNKMFYSSLLFMRLFKKRL